MKWMKPGSLIASALLLASGAYAGAPANTRTVTLPAFARWEVQAVGDELFALLTTRTFVDVYRVEPRTLKLDKLQHLPVENRSSTDTVSVHGLVTARLGRVSLAAVARAGSVDIRTWQADGSLSPVAGRVPGELAFFVPNRHGDRALLGTFQGAVLRTAVVGPEGMPLGPPSVLPVQDARAMTAVGAPGGFLVAARSVDEMPGSPLFIVHAGEDGTATLLDTIPQKVQTMIWVRGHHRLILVVAADEGTFGIPFTPDGVQRGKPILISDRQRLPVIGVARNGRLRLLAGLIEGENAKAAEVVLFDVDLASGKVRSTTLLGPRWSLGATLFRDAFYVVTMNEFAHRFWLTRVPLPR